MKDSSGWKIIEESYYAQFDIFSAKRSRRRNERTGTEFDFFLMEGRDWVTVIPFTAAGEIVLVRQYRHGAELFSLETPGGVIDEGEAPIEAARRELREETGFVAERLEPLGAVYANAAMQGMQLHCFAAYNAAQTAELSLDPGENITTVVKPEQEVFEMLRSGEISHGPVVMAFGLLLTQRLKR